VRAPCPRATLTGLSSKFARSVGDALRDESTCRHRNLKEKQMSTLAIDHGPRNTPESSPEPASNAKGIAYAQGDVLLLRVADVERADLGTFSSPVILAEGEVTGHRHAFYGGAVMFRDDALAGNVTSELYIGHVKIAAGGAVLEHGSGPGQRGDHDPINIPPGTYIALRQREYTGPHGYAGTQPFRRVID
jgi:hypothetical protein